MPLPVLLGLGTGIVVLLNLLILGTMALARHADDRAITLQEKGQHGHTGSAPPQHVG